MVLFVALLWTFASAVATDKARPLPELQSLWDVTNTRSTWPQDSPEDRPDTTSWPGQGLRFGQVVPKTRVTLLDAPPTSVEAFESEYVWTSTPIAMDGLLEQMVPKKSTFNLKTGLDSGRAGIAVVEARDISNSDVSLATLRDVYKRSGDAGGAYTRDHLHSYFKTQVALPPLLHCGGVVDRFVDTRHVYFTNHLAFPLVKEKHHQIYCQVDGVKEFLLMGNEDFPSWSQLYLKETDYGDMAPAVNVYAVDYAQTPQVRDVRNMHIARLEAGQCLFVPAGWIHQQNSLGLDHSIEIRWQRQETNEPSVCTAYISKLATLGDVPWPGEGVPKPLERTVDAHRRAVDLTSVILDTYVVRNEGETTIVDLKEFIRKVSKDPVLVANLPEWNAECADVAEEIFALLDRNKDGLLDTQDLVGMEEEDLTLWTGKILDREHDLAEIIFDMRVDFSGVMFNGTLGRISAEEMVYHHQQRELEKLAEYREEQLNRRKSVKDEL